MKKLAFLIIPLILISQTVFAESFVDVNEGNPYFTSINYLKEKGLINGYEDNTFKSTQNINRAEALKMILVTSGIKQEEINNFEIKENPFNDTPKESWYAKYLAIAKEKEIINGNKDGNFKPLNNINLAESLKMLFEAAENIDFSSLEYPNNEQLIFTDTPATDWYVPYTKYAASLSILNIYKDNTINPSQEMTRGYLTEIIYRYLLSKDGYKFGKATWYGGITANSPYTTAHKTLPFGSVVQVTNLSNGKSVDAVVNDRGPFGHGRELDLNKNAFEKISSLGTGIINIQYKVIHLP